MSEGKTYTSHRMAFPRHTDYACSVQRWPKIGLFERWLRAMGIRMFRNYES